MMTNKTPPIQVYCTKNDRDFFEWAQARLHFRSLSSFIREMVMYSVEYRLGKKVVASFWDGVALHKAAAEIVAEHGLAPAQSENEARIAEALANPRAQREAVMREAAAMRKVSQETGPDAELGEDRPHQSPPQSEPLRDLNALPGEDRLIQHVGQ